MWEFVELDLEKQQNVNNYCQKWLKTFKTRKMWLVFGRLFFYEGYWLNAKKILGEIRKNML